VPVSAASVRSDPWGVVSLLVIQNLRDQPASGATFTLRASPLCGTPAASLVYPAGAGGQVASPALTPQGGFEKYAPLDTIPASSTLVVELSPARP
jgi:hypothetical protein